MMNNECRAATVASAIKAFAASAGLDVSLDADGPQTAAPPLLWRFAAASLTT
ncbi:hypothetical protein [Brucella intermedia]|uniref:hypothetical protein n=1 Tax=Brucella intermedia TaxID=94625 RepID=UPI0023623141|nr:hypothetical protein [Brucella intermedia]